MDGERRFPDAALATEQADHLHGSMFARLAVRAKVEIDGYAKALTRICANTHCVYACLRYYASVSRIPATGQDPMHQLAILQPIALPACLADAEISASLSFAELEKSAGTRRVYRSDFRIFNV